MSSRYAFRLCCVVFSSHPPSNQQIGRIQPSLAGLEPGTHQAHAVLAPDFSLVSLLFVDAAPSPQNSVRLHRVQTPVLASHSFEIGHLVRVARRLELVLADLDARVAACRTTWKDAQTLFRSKFSAFDGLAASNNLIDSSLTVELLLLLTAGISRHVRALHAGKRFA